MVSRSRAVGAIIFRIAYGYHLAEGPQKDPFLEMAETASENFASSTKPAAFLVDIVPARESAFFLPHRFSQ